MSSSIHIAEVILQKSQCLPGESSMNVIIFHGDNDKHNSNSNDYYNSPVHTHTHPWSYDC